VLTVRPSDPLSATEESEVGQQGVRLLGFLAPGRDHDVRIGRAGGGPDL
jgi:hypothetical protein